MTDNLYIKACAVAQSVRNKTHSRSAVKFVQLCIRRHANEHQKYSFHPLAFILAITSAEEKYKPLISLIGSNSLLEDQHQ